MVYVAVGASGDLAQLLINIENLARRVAEAPRSISTGPASGPTAEG